MNKKFTQLRWLAATLMLVAAMLMPSVAWADGSITPSKPKTGDGSAGSPYQISNKEELYWFAGLVNGDKSVCNDVVNQNTAACAKLMNDIVVNSDDDFSNHNWNSISRSNWFFWTPIGKQEFNIYTGTFDGQGHTISGLYFESCSNYYDQNSKEYDYQNRDYLSFGLFGFNSGTIKNVGVINSYFGWQYNLIGGICGENSGTIENCYNEGKVEGKGDDTGGICARNFGTITNCYNLGTVIGKYGTGGVCGDIYDNRTITNCYYLSGTATGGINGADVEGSAESKTADQFKSGEVAYLLSQGCTVGEGESAVTYSGSVWGQQLGTDDYPVLGGLPVYYRDEVYTNTYGILTVGTNTITTSNEPLVWYEFTPTETGSYQFSSTQLTAGNLYVNTTKAESDYTDIKTSPTYDLEAATTYYVAVNYAPGSYDLTITRINNTPTAIETVTAPQIYAVDGRIVCDGEYRIYDLLGRDVTRLNGSLCGVYVVKTTDAAQKVVVR